MKIWLFLIVLGIVAIFFGLIGIIIDPFDVDHYARMSRRSDFTMPPIDDSKNFANFIHRSGCLIFVIGVIFTIIGLIGYLTAR